MVATVRNTSAALNMGTIGARVGALRTKIDQRLKVNPADIDEIRGIYNDFILHDHTYYDVGYVAYGSSPPKGSQSETKTSQTVLNAPVDNTQILAGTTDYGAFAGEVFELIGNMNDYVSTHEHEINDVIL